MKDIESDSNQCWITLPRLHDWKWLTVENIRHLDK